MSDPARLTEGPEVLLRQVHPTHAKTDGSLSAQAFTPTKRDAGLLSTMRERVGAAEAYCRWLDEGRESLGTYGISVGEVDGVAIDLDAGGTGGLRAIDDSEHVGVVDHASIDFTELPTPGKVRQAARKVREIAIQRGILHPPS